MISSLRHLAGSFLVKNGASVSRHEDTSSDFREPDGATPLKDVEFVVFDTELTGLNLNMDSIVSIGAVRMRGDRILLGETFYRLVAPRTALTAKSIVIHEITPSETAGSPGIETSLPEFLDFCGEAVIAGHVVSIDVGFVNREMKHLYGKVLRNRAVDTCKLYQWVRKKEEDVCAFHGGLPETNDLYTLAKKYHIPVQQAHNSLSDAFVTAQLLQRLLGELPKWGITTLGGLLKSGSP
jgi:DNA polymerase III subunit epsilon